jgi:hypothetical protein
MFQNLSEAITDSLINPDRAMPMIAADEADEIMNMLIMSTRTLLFKEYRA